MFSFQIKILHKRNMINLKCNPLFDIKLVVDQKSAWWHICVSELCFPFSSPIDYLMTSHVYLVTFWRALPTSITGVKLLLQHSFADSTSELLLHAHLIKEVNLIYTIIRFDHDKMDF